MRPLNFIYTKFFVLFFKMPGDVKFKFQVENRAKNQAPKDKQQREWNFKT